MEFTSTKPADVTDFHDNFITGIYNKLKLMTHKSPMTAQPAQFFKVKYQPFNAQRKPLDGM